MSDPMTFALAQAKALRTGRKLDAFRRDVIEAHAAIFRGRHDGHRLLRQAHERVWLALFERFGRPRVLRHAAPIGQALLRAEADTQRRG